MRLTAELIDSSDPISTREDSGEDSRESVRYARLALLNVIRGMGTPVAGPSGNAQARFLKRKTQNSPGFN